MGKTPFFDEEKVWHKIKYYCSYRERCHFEVETRLFGMGLPKKQVELLICRLIEAGFLNEERFAKIFAGSHFRLKKWGKIKIIAALRQKKLNEALIKTALKEIDTADYTAGLHRLAARKWQSLKNQPIITRQAKTWAYLLQKGYETGVVQQAISVLRTGKEA
jgi:regulatory protein